MRYALAAIAPNITLPIWARLFRESILPTVDACKFIVGTPIDEMQELARDVLAFAAPLVDDKYHGHGEAITELVRTLSEKDEFIVLEDDCFVTATAAFLESIWSDLPTWGVMGSRMARTIEESDYQRNHKRHEGPDTFGTGLYPNMCFCRMATLLEHCPDLDFRSRLGGDVGQLVGERLHARGVHVDPGAHLPQLRLSRYPGCLPVDPLLWSGPWLHVGEMSGIPSWRVTTLRGGHYEALAAYAAALDDPDVREGQELTLMRSHVRWAEERPALYGDYYQACKALMGRAYAS